MSLEDELAAFSRVLTTTSPSEAEREALGLDERGVRVYRKLVRRNFRGALERMAPRFAAAMGSALAPLLEAFLAAGMPRSRYLRDVPLELVRFAREALVDPPWAADLGELELSSFRAMAAPDEDAREAEDLELDRGVRLAGSVVLLDLTYAVLGWGDAGAPPERRRQRVLVHRTRDQDLAEHELSPLVGDVLHHLLMGATLGAAVASGAAAAGRPVDPALVAEVAGILEHLRASGALVGPR